MNIKPYLKIRTFLNSDKELAAFIVADFQTSYWINSQTKKKIYTVEGEIKIADCNRTISLDFSGYRKRDLNKALFKLKILEQTIVSARRALIKMHKDIEKSK